MAEGVVGRLAAAVRRREVSSVELVERALVRVEELDPPLRAFVHVDADGARAAAADLDRRLAAGGDVGPLAGVPFAVKDLEDVAGMPTGKGCRWFTGGPAATRDDLHVERLKAAGAVPVGKTATPELGWAPFTASAVHGVTGNPWDPARTPGGSSGGSAAAVAAGLVPFATASDGGGSIRTPASCTGLPGLRPGYGRVPTYGATHLAQNAVVFALAPTVADTALLLDVCAGPDRRDRTSLPAPPVPYRRAVEELDVAGLRVAWSPSFGLGRVDREVEALVLGALARLVATAGLDRVDVDVRLPSFGAVYLKVEGVDRFVDLPAGLWPDRADELGPELGPGWASAARARLPQFAAVQTERHRLELEVAALFDRFDVLVTPTIGVPPFPATGPLPAEVDGHPCHPFEVLAQPILASLCNLPAISVPAGLTAGGLPVGMQVMAGLHREDICLRLARLLEAAGGWPTHPWRAGGFDDSPG